MCSNNTTIDDCVNLFSRIDKRGYEGKHDQEDTHTETPDTETPDTVRTNIHKHCANVLGTVTIGTIQYTLEEEEGPTLVLYDDEEYKVAWQDCDDEHGNRPIHTRIGSTNDLDSLDKAIKGAKEAMLQMSNAAKNTFMTALTIMQSRKNHSDTLK